MEPGKLLAVGASVAALAKDAQRRALAEVRRKAWETRRAKHGPAGHSQVAYRPRGATAMERARDEISVARRHCQLMLPDEAAHKAITALDRADDYLAAQTHEEAP